jgi:hypothetical protein
MARRHTPASTDVNLDLDAALDAMEAEALRELIRDLLIEVDDRTHSRTLDEITARAARSQSGWAPDALPASTVAAILSFAESAARMRYAEPSEVDEYLRQGIHAFLARDYRSAVKVFGALLPPLGDAEIYLGQHEMLDEVLSVDTAACTAMYVVASYMSVDHAQRADVVWTAIEEVHALGIFLQPLREMERVAVESLPRFDNFLHQWHALIEDRRGEPDSEWDTDEDRWLREVIERTEGADGLAELARVSKRANDLRAWCHALTAANDWEAAFAAYKEAADTVATNALARAGFLDGVALAAQLLERNDLHHHLERAWREMPTLLRLRRWLGSAKSGAVLRKRAQQALEGCSKKAARQLGLLHIVLGDLKSAAALLADAPGLGWSDTDHPGHLLFPLFQQLLGGCLFRRMGRRPARLGGGRTGRATARYAWGQRDLAVGFHRQRRNRRSANHGA